MRFGKISFVFALVGCCVSLMARADIHVPDGADSLPHPCVLITQSRLAVIRKEILQDKNWRKSVYERYTKANADRWLRRSIAVPPTGGWIHDYFCVDGSMLEVPRDQQFDPHVPSRCPVCGRIYMNDKILAARRSFMHYWLCQAARNLGLVYAIEGKNAYAKKAIEILVKYADVYPRQRILRQTLEEAVTLIPLAETYDLVYDAMTPAQRAHIRDSLLWPGAELLTKAGFGGNWGSWHLSAIGVIGYATGNRHFIDFAIEKFKMQIGEQLGKDGLWPESVSTYHFYPLDGFLAFAEAAGNNGNDLWDWKGRAGKSIRDMFTAPLRYAYPNMRLAAINDGWYDAYLPQDQYTMAYSHFHLPELAWAARQVQKGGKSGVPGDLFDQHYRNLLYGEKLPQRPAKPVLGSVNFPVLGIAVLRQGSDLPANREMMMTFDYGPFLGHGQPDKMGVTLFANGKLWAPDYGTTGYGSAEDRFLRSTPAHNTIVVDGKDQPRTPDRDLIAFTSMPSFKLAAARTTKIAPGVTWTRTVMLMDTCALIWDHIKGAEAHRYDWFFHAEGRSLSVRDAQEFPDTAATGDPGYAFLTDIKKCRIGGMSGLAEWRSDKDGMALWFFHSDSGETFVSRMPTAYEQHRVPLLNLRQHARHADFIAVIKPLDQTVRSAGDLVHFDKKPDGGFTITVSLGGRKDEVRLTDTGVVYSKGGDTPVQTLFPPVAASPVDGGE